LEDLALGLRTASLMLYGRDAERSRIGELLEGARASRSAVFAISGEPGVGKSALLENARERATDMLVLSGNGVESEAQLPFAALHQIVRPVLSRLENLPEPQATALRGALGLSASGSDNRFLVAVAVLSLLAEAAERQPLLCLVDDAHWLDDASADALVFVARRLEAEGIVMLFAAREGEARGFDAHGLPELHLRGLDADAAAVLLDRQLGVPLSAETRERLIEGSGGNPLALLALSTTLSEAQLTGAEPLLEPLPVSARVERAFAGRVRGLPDETQTLLLVAAVCESGELATVLLAAKQLGAQAEALDAAEQAELLHVDGERLEFRHPLVRSAVHQAAPLSKRRAAHRALASVLVGELDADRRVWHRAAASIGPDASVAEELEQTAWRARRRSAVAAASMAFERAAAMTTDERHRVRLLTGAVETAWAAGRAERALMLLERARPSASEPIERAEIDRCRGLIELNVGVPADAHQLFVRAAQEIATVDAERALYMLSLAAGAALYAGDSEGMAAIAELAGRLADDDSPAARFLVHFLLGTESYFRGAFSSAARSLRNALEVADEADATGSATYPGC
jgi:predicted ATPase